MDVLNKFLWRVSLGRPDVSRIVVAGAVAAGVAAQFKRAAWREYEIYRARRREAAEAARLGAAAPPGSSIGAGVSRRMSEDLDLMTGALNSARSLSGGFRAAWRARLARILTEEAAIGVDILDEFARELDEEVGQAFPKNGTDDVAFRLRRLEQELDKIRVGWAGVWRALMFERESDGDAVGPGDEAAIVSDADDGAVA